MVDYTHFQITGGGAILFRGEDTGFHFESVSGDIGHLKRGGRMISPMLMASQAIQTVSTTIGA